MARRKPELTQEQLDTLADKAQDLSFDIHEAAESINLMVKLKPTSAAAKFNQLAEAAIRMNRSLLAMLTQREDIAELEVKMRAEMAKTDAVDE
jgi:hypothetical protein